MIIKGCTKNQSTDFKILTHEKCIRLWLIKLGYNFKPLLKDVTTREIEMLNTGLSNSKRPL